MLFHQHTWELTTNYGFLSSNMVHDPEIVVGGLYGVVRVTCLLGMVHYVTHHGGTYQPRSRDPLRIFINFSFVI